MIKMSLILPNKVTVYDFITGLISRLDICYDKDNVTNAIEGLLELYRNFDETNFYNGDIKIAIQDTQIYIDEISINILQEAIIFNLHIIGEGFNSSIIINSIIVADIIIYSPDIKNPFELQARYTNSKVFSNIIKNTYGGNRIDITKINKIKFCTLEEEKED